MLLRWYFTEDDWSHRPFLPVVGPKQTNIEKTSTWPYKDWVLTGLAQYTIQARLLSKACYHWDAATKLSPIDLVLGWGAMADPALSRQIQIAQAFRWYTIKIPPQLQQRNSEIQASIANIHILPGSSTIEKQIKAAPLGAILTLRGFLIEGKGPQGQSWRSSLSQTGTEAGEVFYVDQAVID